MIETEFDKWAFEKWATHEVSIQASACVNEFWDMFKPKIIDLLDDKTELSYLDCREVVERLFNNSLIEFNNKQQTTNERTTP